MRNLVILLILMLILPCSFSQVWEVDQRSDLTHIQKNAIYMELLDMGIIYSINYERTFPIARQLALGTRVGITSHFIVTPVLELNVRALGPNHLLDAGMGVEFTDVITDSGKLSPNLHIGYRYQGAKVSFSDSRLC